MKPTRAGGAPDRQAWLGLQQTLAAVPSIAALPLLMGLDASVALLCAGTGSLLFLWITRSRVPVLLGSSYSFAYLLVSAAQVHGSAQAAGAAGLAGCVYVAAAAGLRLVPASALRRLLPPYLSATAVLVLGLALAPVAVQAADGATSPGVVDAIGSWGAWFVAGVAFAAGVATQVAASRPGRERISRLPVLVALAAGTLLSIGLGIVDFAPVLKAPWVGLPHLSLPRLAPQLILTSVAVGIVAAVEQVCDLLAMEVVTGEDYIRDPTLSHTLLATGGATMISAAVGGPPLAFSSESVGVAAVRERPGPIAIRWAAIAMIVISFLPKVGATVAAIPRVVMGGVSILLYGALCVHALRRLAAAHFEAGGLPVLVVVASMLVLGVGGAQLSAGPFVLSGVALALIVGVLLNLALAPRRPEAAAPLRRP